MHVEDIHHILIVGAGTMGQQIGLQCAMHGFDVTIYDIAPAMLETAQRRIEGYTTELTTQGRLTESEAKVVLERIKTTNDPKVAAEGADLLSESVPEDPKIKGKVFEQFNQLCPAHTVFTTNTSTLVPSQYAEATGRPAQFCAFHFHNPVWTANVVDIMPHPGTSPETIALLQDFAAAIDQIPIFIKKETHSYVFNAMLNGFLREALTLAANEVASFEDVDRAWMGVTKMPVGPFGVLDIIGIDLVYEIINNSPKWQLLVPQLRRVRNFLKGYVEKGKLGIKSEEGFYHYPDPAFQDPGFVTARHGKVDDL